MSIGNKDGKQKDLVFGPSKTKQSFKETSDINNVIARYRKNGSFDYVSGRVGAFVDVSNIGDFASIQSRIAAAQQSFERLPAYIRSRFQNDAGNLIAFLADAKNYDEAVALGLAKPKPKEKGSSGPAPAPSDGSADSDKKPAEKPNV